MGKVQGFCSVLLLMMVGIGLPMRAQSYEKLWKQVKEAQNKSLPQTVIKLTDEIYRKGEREQNAPQMLKAYICRGASQIQLTPDSLYANLKHLERWVQSEKHPLNKAILHSLLADQYTDFVRNNRRSLLGRTLLHPDEAPDDIREWSLSQFIHRIDGHTRASLHDSIQLLEVSSRQYVPFTVLEEGSRFYRHDMYHLLANRAIATYKELGLFDTDSFAHNRIGEIYRNLINAYQHRAGSEDAVLLCSLNYWDWRATSGISPEPYETFGHRREQARKEYLGALNELIEKYGSREVCAEAFINKAIYLRNPDVSRLAEALRVCDEGLKRYPSYKRIGELKNIREGILRPHLFINTSKGAYPGDSLTMNVSYRNLNGFTINLYRTTLSEVPLLDHGINKAFMQKYTRKLSSKHIRLKPQPRIAVTPEEMPYQSSDTLFANEWQLPDDLGVYILQIVPDALSTPTEEHFLVVSRIKVLTLSLPDNKLEVVTLDARSGQPIPNAQVTFYSSLDEKERKVLAEVTTDAAGKAIVEWNKNIRSYVARKGTDTAMLPQQIYHRGSMERGDGRQHENVTLLTDRSLYRPGQTVYLKGIAYLQAADSAHVLEGKAYQVSLLDVNRAEVMRKEVCTNEFGSFTTEFVLPAVCLNGNFTIEVKGNRSVSVRVEEYKRPTFDVLFNPVKQAYVLGDTVTVTGNVKSYSGVALQEASLAYTVTRRNHLNRAERNFVSLASDTIRLDAQGNFSIPLILRPGDTNLMERRALYAFRIEAVVTGDAGETQTALFNLNATEHAYSFHSDIQPEWCKEDSLVAMLKIGNASDQMMAIEGTYRLYPVVNERTLKMGEKPLAEGTFTSGEEKDLSAWKQLPSGRYGLVLSALGPDGKEVSNAERNPSVFLLFSRSDRRPAQFMDSFLYEQNTTFDATHPAAFSFGTSHKDAYVLIDVFSAKGRVESHTLTLNDSIIRMEYPYKEEYGEWLVALFTFVKNGQIYTRRVELRKRLPDRTLNIKWKVFRDRLRPGQEEEWSLVIRTPQGYPAAAEMLATMCDASLDQIYSRYQALRLFYSRYTPSLYWSESHLQRVMFTPYFPTKSWKVPVWRFDRFYSLYEPLLFGNSDMMLQESVVVDAGSTRNSPLTAGLTIRGANKMFKADVGREVGFKSAYSVIVGSESESFDSMDVEEELLQVDEESLKPAVGLRANFAETAFFYPQLRTNGQGEVAFSFIMPQSLTRWNFRSYSHTKSMLTGMLDATAVTAKEFMLSPNMPRFVRVGDKTRIAGSIANLTGKALKGTVTFTLFDPLTEKVISTRRQNFSVEAGRTTSVNFPFEATGHYDVIGVRMIADGGTFSDGEQHLLPVLSNKEYLTETLPISLRGEQTRTFVLDSLFNRNSHTATDRRLTVEFTGNPVWYAVQALPVLSLPRTDNAVSWATAYYANCLAGFIANSQPRIKALFDSWKAVGGTKETLLSQLEKNQEVKNILLSESPWVMEATTETEQQARIATLFDVNLLNNRNLAALTKLKELQEAEGSWSWYKGMPGSRNITTSITELLVRLPLLTQAEIPAEVAAMKRNAFGYLHKAALEEYRTIRKAEKAGAKATTISDATMHYLYLLAISGEKVPASNEAAYRYFFSMLARNLQSGTMVCKAQSAMILQKAGRMTEANEFIASIRQHLVQTDEMGAHFAFHENPYSWGMMPVPAHVKVMEALLMAGGNDLLVEEMKLWLLKQKQTTSWNSPLATADAVYALLCQGGNWLENRGDLRITLGNNVMETLSPASGTIPSLSYLKQTFTQGSPELKAKSITVEKRDAGIAWGALYAHYLSPLSDVKQKGGELHVEKKMFVERVAANGQKSLQPLTDVAGLSMGDKIVSRLTIRLNRAMDFVQLKDRRGACFEPIGALSGYRWSDGFGYYVEVEDAATNFFFDHLGKGVYVLEHSYRIARGGTYEIGPATIQCAYAPEYASHSAGGTIVIK